jgi:flagellar biogenesis protein FliO
MSHGGFLSLLCRKATPTLSSPSNGPKIAKPLARGGCACLCRQQSKCTIFCTFDCRTEGYAGKRGTRGRETNENINQDHGTDDRCEIDNGATLGGPASRAGSGRISALATLHAGVRPSGGELYRWRSAEPHQRLHCRDRVPPKQRLAPPCKRTTGWMDRIRGRWRTSCRAAHRPVMRTLRSRKSNLLTSDASLLPVLVEEVSSSTVRSHTGLLSRAWGWLHARQVARSGTRRLRVAETVSLGEKRFVAVVQVDGRHFLLAGGPTNIVLLAQLDAKDAFEEVLKKTLTLPGKKVAKPKRPANLAPQAQLNRTNSRTDLPPKKTPVRTRQAEKRPSSQNAVEQRAVNAPPLTHLNGMENFGDVLQKTMSAVRHPGNQPRKQNLKSTAEQTGYYA